MCSSRRSKDKDVRERRFLKLWRHVKGFRAGPDLIKDMAHRSEITLERARELVKEYRISIPILDSAVKEMRRSMNHTIQSQEAAETFRQGSFVPKNLMIFETDFAEAENRVVAHYLNEISDKLCKDCTYWGKNTPSSVYGDCYIPMPIKIVSACPPSFGCILWERRKDGIEEKD